MTPNFHPWNNDGTKDVHISSWYPTFTEGTSVKPKMPLLFHDTRLLPRGCGLNSLSWPRMTEMARMAHDFTFGHEISLLNDGDWLIDVLSASPNLFPI